MTMVMIMIGIDANIKKKNKINNHGNYDGCNDKSCSFTPHPTKNKMSTLPPPIPSKNTCHFYSQENIEMYQCNLLKLT